MIAVADDKNSDRRLTDRCRIERAIARAHGDERCGDKDNRHGGNYEEKAPAPAPGQSGMTFLRNRHPALVYWLSMICSENRYPLFGTMLYEAFARRSSASTIFTRRDSASSRFSRSPSTTSSGARLRKSALASLASTRAMSPFTLVISFSSRARSAAKSINPASARPTVSPRTNSWTVPGAYVGARRTSDIFAILVMNADHRCARDHTWSDVPAKTSGRGTFTFISARTDRIAEITSITHPISDSALGSKCPGPDGHSVSASRLRRFACAVTVHSSSVTNGMKG